MIPYSNLIAEIRDRTAVPPVSKRLEVKRVAVMLTSSRSGSSYVKSILAQHPDIAALPGEEEPYYILTGNGFGQSSASDAFHDVNDIELLAAYVEHDLQVSGDLVSEEQLIRYLAALWHRRLPMQLPHLVIDRDQVEATLRWALPCDQSFNERFLTKLLGPRQAGWYDDVQDKSPFSLYHKVEEPPFVSVPFRRPIRTDEIGAKTLLFKTPQNVYRPGVFEQLYPNAEIKYIHLIRNMASTVNGLIDGWLCNYGFYAHNLETEWSDGDTPKLRISGYSDTCLNGNIWWKFDMPPKWTELTRSPLPDVCLYQWLSAHGRVLSDDMPALPVYFESLLQRRQQVLNGVTEFLGLPSFEFKDVSPIMSTERPSPYRWRKREDTIMELARRPDVHEMMGELGLDTDPETWI